MTCAHIIVCHRCVQSTRCRSARLAERAWHRAAGSPPPGARHHVAGNRVAPARDGGANCEVEDARHDLLAAKLVTRQCCRRHRVAPELAGAALAVSARLLFLARHHKVREDLHHLFVDDKACAVTVCSRFSTSIRTSR